MSDFRTTFPIPESDKKISLSSRLLSVGSCFSDTVGKKLSESRFSILANPYGTLFSPPSISKLLMGSIDLSEPDPDGFVRNNGIWYHYDFHGSLSHTDRDTLKHELESVHQRVNEKLRSADWLIITWGTAFVYERTDHHGTVANCHKIRADSFRKQLLSTQKIIGDFENLLADLLTFNPSLNIILTVSPVRHRKDTLPLNTVSKSSLRLASHHLEQQHERVRYFPAYEILLDDLRDYRFYADDLLHPSEVAVSYIWEKFASVYIDLQGQEFIRRWKKLRTAMDHRPFHPGSEAHRSFLAETIKELEDINSIVDVSVEIEHLRNQLTS